MKKLIIVMLCTAFASGMFASEKKEIVNLSKKYAKSLLHKNINDSKAIDVVSFMEFLDSKSTKSLKKDMKKGKIERTSFSATDLESYVGKLCDRGDSYAKKGYKNTARLYYQVANYSDMSDEKSSNKLSSIGFSSDSYPMVIDLIKAAKLELKSKKITPKKEDRPSSKKIDISKIKNKIMSSELQKAKDHKKLDIKEQDRVMKGSKDDEGYAERRLERIKAFNEKRKEKRERLREQMRRNARYGGHGNYNRNVRRSYGHNR